MRAVTFHAEADAEMREAASFYEERSSGLGALFLAEIETAIEVLSAHPSAGPKAGREIRRRRIRRFPYSLLYAVEGRRLRILAVAHHSRRPGYWRHRR